MHLVFLVQLKMWNILCSTSSLFVHFKDIVMLYFTFQLENLLFQVKAFTSNLTAYILCIRPWHMQFILYLLTTILNASTLVKLVVICQRWSWFNSLNKGHIPDMSMHQPLSYSYAHMHKCDCTLYTVFVVIQYNYSWWAWNS